MFPRRALTSGALALVGLAVAAGGLLAPAAASASTYSVTSAADAGPGTLRQRILDANAHPGADSVKFKLPGSGVQTIAITTPLPQVSETLTINGRSQPGFAGTPLVRVDNASGTQLNGLRIAAGQSQVLGLELTRFAVAVRVAGDANRVQGNLIGTNAAGDAGLGNATGVRVESGAENRIGGIAPNAPNVVSANTNAGIEVVGGATTATLVAGNRIGTDPTGTLARPNGIGVRIGNGSTSNVVGGTTAEARNVISGNAAVGVQIVNAGTTHNTVAGNRIGTDPAGTGKLANGTGVRLASGASGNTIGGPTAGARNVISGNTANGVEFLNAGTTGNTVAGNYIGVDATGGAKLANGDGVFLDDAASGNTVGGAVAGAGNVISGNDTGVFVTSAGNVVAGNLVGTDAGGTAALGNAIGILLRGRSADGNTIGGTTAAARNVISGNYTGVALFREADNNTIAGNYVGLTAPGTAALANTCGVCLQGGGGEARSVSLNTIGGTTGGARNVISGNYTGVSIGAYVGSGAVGNRVVGNFIGTDPTGGAVIGNRVGVGVAAYESGYTVNTTIGGTTAAARNVISGNAAAGVTFFADDLGYLRHNTVSGNYIGTNADGSAALANGVGVQLFGDDRTSDNTVGGTDPGARNLISGNAGDGVLVRGPGDPTLGPGSVTGNYLGTKAGGGHALGNGGAGIRLEDGAQHVPIEANRIAFNAGPGIVVDGALRPYGSGQVAARDSILRNSIYTNGGLGIDLLNGGNHDQAAPAITAVTTNGGSTTIDGTLDSTASTTFRIELFSSPKCDPSGAGEGKTFLGSTDVTTDGTGHATFSSSVAALPAGQAVTATATSAATHDTSEFSTCFTSP